MARRRKTRRSFARAVPRSFFKRRTSRRKGSGLSTQKLLMGGAAYGALRPFVSDKIASVVPGVFGQYGDEVVMGMLAVFARKKLTGIGKDVATAALAVEAARVGESLTAQVSTRNQITQFV